MQTFLVATSLLALTVGGASAEERADRLRRAAKMPSIELQIPFDQGLSLDERRVEEMISETEAKTLEATLTGTPGDAATLLQLAKRTPKTEAGRAWATRAAGAYRALLEDQPGRGDLLVGLGRALHVANDPAAEATLREGLTLEPNHAEGWLDLGWLLLGRLYRDGGGVDTDAETSLSGAALEQSFERIEDAGRGANGSQLRALLAGAIDAFDRAAEAEPVSANALANRGFHVAMLYPHLRCALRPPEETRESCRGPVYSAALRDSIRAFELDPRQVGMLGGIHLMACMRAGEADGQRSEPAEERDRAILAARRILGRAAAGTGDVAAEAALFVGLAQAVFLGEFDAARQNLMKAVKRFPERENAWYALIGALASTGRLEELVALAPEIVKHQNTPRFRFMLAKACFSTGRFDDARGHLAAALRADGADSRLHAARAALALRDPKGSSDLETARQALDTAATLDGAGAEPLRSEILDLRAILEALSGHRDAALAALDGLDAETRSETEIQELRKTILAE